MRGVTAAKFLLINNSYTLIIYLCRSPLKVSENVRVDRRGQDYHRLSGGACSAVM